MINKESVPDALQELSDVAYQERVWTWLSAGEMFSFEECFESLFGGSGLADALEKGEVYGEEVDGQLRKLELMMKSIDADKQYDEPLDNPRPVDARILASEVLRRISDRNRRS